MTDKNNDYECDKCGQVIDDNKTAVEVSYGYICFDCTGN